MGTPLQLVDVLMHGFQEWLDPAVHSGRRSHSPTFGSLRPSDILLTQANAIQFYSIGWYQLCLRRICRKWRALLPPTQPHNPLNWGSNLIYALRQFTKSIWDHGNTIVHGADAAESATRTLASLRDQVRQHYQFFEASKSYVLAHHRYIFSSRTL
jgi:hypothetical protein